MNYDASNRIIDYKTTDQLIKLALIFPKKVYERQNSNPLNTEFHGFSLSFTELILNSG
jgi:hypothetical protein